jgi:porin
MKERLWLSGSLFFVVMFASIAQSSDSCSNNSVELNLVYTADAGRNFSGGIKAGNVYMGLLKADIIVRSDKLIKGSEFVLQLMNSHGGYLSGNYVGDMQIISNIENGNYTFLEKFYYRQNFSKFSFVVGLQDLNEEFVTCEYGGALTNSSFGIHSAFPLNFSVPIYPKTTLAIVAIYSFNDNFTFKTSLFDGDAGSLEEDPHNIKWTLSPEEGYLNVNEFEYKTNSDKPLCVKLGEMYNTGEFVDTDNDSAKVKGDMGFYATCDKLVFKSGSRKVGLFGQLAIFPSKANYNTLYVGGGLNFTGMFEKRSDDCLAAGCAYSKLFDDTYECDLEFNYMFAFGNHITVQPTFHYIIHPGANLGLKNAFAGFVRFSLTK